MSGSRQPSPLRGTALRPTFCACLLDGVHAAALGGRVLATIRGALGTAVLAGRDGLLVCSCSVREKATETSRTVWTYDRVAGLASERKGTVQILLLTIRGRAEGLPLIALDPAMDGARAAIDRVQYMIDAAHDRQWARVEPEPADPPVVETLATAGR
jgi:hypothetical protein